MTILLLTLEGHKPVDERNYAAAYDEFETAEVLSEQADDLGYYYNAKYYMDELIENGWEDFQLQQAGVDNPSSEAPREGFYNPAGNPYTTLTIGRIEDGSFRFHYGVNDIVYCSNTLATLEGDVYTYSVDYGTDMDGNKRTGLSGNIRFLNDGTVEFVITESPHQAWNGTTIFTYAGELTDLAKEHFEEGMY